MANRSSCIALGLVLAAGLALAPAATGQQQKPAAPGLVEKGPGIEKFMRIRAPGAPTLAPDGSMYLRDWPDGVWQLFRVAPAANGQTTIKPGDDMARLTNFKDGCTGFSLSEDGSKLLVMTAAGGNEKTQVYLLDQKNTDPATNLTPVLVNPEVVHTVQKWLPDNSGFLYTANDKSPNDFYVYRYDFTPGAKDDKGNPVAGKSTLLVGNAGSWDAGDITRDGKRVLVGEFRSSSDSTLFELDVASGKLTPIHTRVAGEGKTVSIDAVGYAPDEKSVYFLSDHEQDGVGRLYSIDLATGKVSQPIPALAKNEVEDAGINQERTLLSVSVNEDGYGVPHLYALPDLKEIALPNLDRGLAGIADIRGDTLVYTLTNARTPGLAYEYKIPAPGVPANKARQITFADNQGIDLNSFPLPQLIKYKAADGLEIPAFLYLPPGAKQGQPIPFVVNFHGGPEGQHRPGFDRNTQYLLSEGFGVLMPNVRGSSGYGRTFIMMDDYKNRWLSVSDGVDAAKWLVDNGYARPGKIAGYGGSYGGYMTTATMVEDQERVDGGRQKERLFGASINVVGVINLKTFLENTSGYRRKLREAEYGPLTDPSFLDSVSPLQRVEKINVPMLIAHGLNDPRVPVSEAMQLAEALQRRGYDPEQVYFHDEGHGFQKLENRLLFSKLMSRFLKRHIGG